MSREAIATAPHLRATPRFIWSMQSSPFHDVTLAAFEQGVEYQTMWLLTGQRMRDARERAVAYRWYSTVDDTMRFRETPAQSRCDDGANCGAHDSDCWHATYSYGAPLPPGDTRPPVLGGECARCLAAPPYHERWCPKRMECTR